jgi:hypothetical protein
MNVKRDRDLKCSTEGLTVESVTVKFGRIQLNPYLKYNGSMEVYSMESLPEVRIVNPRCLVYFWRICQVENTQ